MSAEYSTDIKKYTTSVDEKAVAGMAKTYALVMSKADSRYVAASDADETSTAESDSHTEARARVGSRRRRRSAGDARRTL